MLLFCLFSLSLTHSFLNSLCFSFKTTKRYIIILGIDATCLIKINTSVRLIYIVISPATQPFAICFPCLFHFIFAFCLVSLSLSLPPHLKRFLNYEKKIQLLRSHGVWHCNRLWTETRPRSYASAAAKERKKSKNWKLTPNCWWLCWLVSFNIYFYPFLL